MSIVKSLDRQSRKWIQVGTDSETGRGYYWLIRRVKSSLVTRALKKNIALISNATQSSKSSSYKKYIDQCRMHFAEDEENLDLKLDLMAKGLAATMESSDVDLEKSLNDQVGIVCAGVIGAAEGPEDIPEETMISARKRVLEQLKKQGIKPEEYEHLDDDVYRDAAMIHLATGLHHEKITLVTTEADQDLDKGMIFYGAIPSDVFMGIYSEIFKFSGGEASASRFRR